MKKKLLISFIVFIASIGYEQAKATPMEYSDDTTPSEQTLQQINDETAPPSLRVAPPEEDGDGDDLKVVPIGSPKLAGTLVLAFLLIAYSTKKKSNNKYKSTAL